MAQHEGRAVNVEIFTSSRDAAAQEAFKTGVALRDQAEVALSGVGGKNKPLFAEIKVTVGTADTPESLAVGLTQLAAIGTRFLRHKKDVLAARAQLLRLDQAYVDALTDVAKTLRGAAVAASAGPLGKKAPQGLLDKNDGEAFYLLETILNPSRRLTISIRRSLVSPRSRCGAASPRARTRSLLPPPRPPPPPSGRSPSPELLAPA